MVIDINPILKGDKNEVDVEYLLSIDEGLDDILFPEPFSVKGKVKNMAGYITLSLDAEVRYKTNCARCLVPVSESRAISFSKTVITDQTDLQAEDDDDYILSKDGYIEADEALVEQILLELPHKHLCKEDCKGLCLKCGADLNNQTCDCDLNDPDPRFDVLRKLLENIKD